MAEGDGASLPELIVKEAVGAGLDSSMRESILEAVEDAEGRRRGRTLPVAIASFAFGTAIGFALGSAEEPPIEPDAESLPIDESVQSKTPMESVTDEESESGGSRLPKLLLALAVSGGIAYLQYRRRRDEAGWEPIDEVDESLDEASTVVEGIADETTDGEDSEQADTGDASGTDEEGDADEGEASSEEDGES